MKHPLLFSIRQPFAFAAVLIAMQFFPSAYAADLYYNPGLSSPSTWLSNSWSGSAAAPYTAAWVDGNTAIFSSSTAQTVQLVSGNVQVTGLTSLGASTLTLTGTSTGPRRTLTFLDGSQVSSNSTGNTIDFSTNLDVVGNFTLTGGQVNISTGTTTSYSGTATIQTGARIQLSNGLGTTLPNASFVLNGGTFRAGGGQPITIGNMTVNEGTFDMGAAGVGNYSFTVASLSGSGGQVTLRSGAGLSTHQFTVNQATNTTYSGTMQGVNGTRYLALTKSGTGTLILSGSTINLQQGTTVNGGTLLINGTGTRTFDNLAASNAVTVASSGTFGGNATMTIAGGESVVVQEGGSLVAGGGIGSIGTTGLTFSSGGNLDLSSITSGLNWLHFDLGSDATAGTTYDQIRLTGGNLALGVGQLQFDDFDFATTVGFGEGTYTLFASSAHSGSLGALLSGSIGSDYIGTLSLDGSNILLTVSVPEPQTAALVLGGCALTFLMIRRRRLKDSR